MAALRALSAAFEKQYYSNFLLAPPKLSSILYIQPTANLSSDQLSKFELIEKLRTELSANNYRSFLIVGDSGFGKSSAAYYLCKTILDDEENILNFYPLYVSIPKYVKYLTQNFGSDVVDFYLSEFPTLGIRDKSLFAGKNVVFILDSLDEIENQFEIRNIMVSIGDKYGNARFVIFSRLESLPKKSERKNYFAWEKFGHRAHDKYLEIHLCSFSQENITEFVDRFAKAMVELKSLTDSELDAYVQWATLKAFCDRFPEWTLVQSYRGWLTKLPDMSALLSSPCILTIVLQILPQMVVKNEGHLPTIIKICKTRVLIYEFFTTQLFEHQALRIPRTEFNKSITKEHWKGYFKAYAQNLASRMLNEKTGMLIDLNLEDTLNPCLLEPTRDSKLLREFEGNHKHLFPPRLKDKICQQRVDAVDKIHAKLSKEELLEHQINNMKILRSSSNGGLLLCTEFEPSVDKESQYRFAHRSLVEYFAAQDLFESSLSEYDVFVQECLNLEAKVKAFKGLNRTLIHEESILTQLVERVEEGDYFLMLKKLTKISIQCHLLHNISANAVTILNKAGKSFCKEDFTNIQIQGADMRRSMCAQTIFHGANLTDVRFHQSFLLGAHMQGALMSNVQFGQQPLVHVGREDVPNSIVTFSNQELWICASKLGSVYLTTRDGRRVSRFRLKIAEPICVGGFGYTDYLDYRMFVVGNFVGIWTREHNNLKFFKVAVDMLTILPEMSLTFPLPQDVEVRKFGHAMSTIKFQSLNKILIVHGFRAEIIYPRGWFTKYPFPIIKSPPLTYYLELHAPVNKLDNDIENPFEKSGSHLSWALSLARDNFIRIATHESAEGEGFLIVYSVNCGEVLSQDGDRFFELHRISVKPFNRDGRNQSHIVFNQSGQSLAFYDPAGAFESKNRFILWNDFSRIQILPQRSDLQAFTFNHAGTLLAALSKGDLKLWSVPSGIIFQTILCQIFYYSTYPNCLCFSRDDTFLAHGDIDAKGNTVIKMSLVENDVSVVPNTQVHPIEFLAMSPNRNIIVGSSYIQNKAKAGDLEKSLQIFYFPFVQPQTIFLNQNAIDRSNSKIDQFLCQITTLFFAKVLGDKKDDLKICILFDQTVILIFQLDKEKKLYSETGKLIKISKQFEILLQIACKTNPFVTLSLTEDQVNDILICQSNKKSPTSLKNIHIIPKSENRTNNAELYVFDSAQQYLAMFNWGGKELSISISPISNPLRVILLNVLPSIKIFLNITGDERWSCGRFVFSMQHSLLFLLSMEKLRIYSLLPVQERASKIIKCVFGPLALIDFESGLLMTGSRARNVGNAGNIIRIWQHNDLNTVDPTDWIIVTEIPIWFEPATSHFFQNVERNLTHLIIGGHNQNICYFIFDSSNPKNWNMPWSNRPPSTLIANACNVKNAISLDPLNKSVLKQLDGIVGKVELDSLDSESNYVPFQSWCQEIFGTAASPEKFGHSLIQVEGSPLLLTREWWSVSVVGKKVDISKGIPDLHVYFIIEGITWSGRRFVVELHLTVVNQNNSQNTLGINVKPMNEQMYVNFATKPQHSKYSGQQFRVSKLNCLKLMTNIQRDKCLHLADLAYDFYFENCASWCKTHLKNIDIVVEEFVWSSLTVTLALLPSYLRQKLRNAFFPSKPSTSTSALTKLPSFD